MARAPNKKVDEAYELYKKGYKLVDIAKELNTAESTIRVWKNRYKWGVENETFQKNKRNVSNKKSNKESSRNNGLNDGDHNNKTSSKTNSQNPKARYGNKNAVGNVGGKGGPRGNKNSETHGFFSKYLPEESIEVIEDIKIKNPIDILWENILIQYAAIIRSQRIMFVKSKEEMIKELRKSKVKTKTRKTEKTNTDETEEEYEYEFQFAWDRQATFLNAQSRAISELRSSMKQYEEMLQSNLATEEQKLRIAKLKGEVDKLDNSNKDKPIEILIKRKERD